MWPFTKKNLNVDGVYYTPEEQRLQDEVKQYYGVTRIPPMPDIQRIIRNQKDGKEKDSKDPNN